MPGQTYDWKGMGPTDQVEVGTTPQLLPDVPGRGISIKAKSTNTESIFVGDSMAVTTNTGFELLPGDGLRVPATNLNLLYFVSASGGQRFCYVVER